jgi:hypothetical protein
MSAVTVHALVWWGRVGDPMAWYVSLAIVLFAASLILPLLARRGRGHPVMTDRISERDV